MTFPLQCKLLSSAASPGLRIGESDRKSALDQLKTDLRTLATTIKARWVCGQSHQQMKDELGLDHFEGRSWQGLHHHALMMMSRTNIHSVMFRGFHSSTSCVINSS